MTAGLFSGPFLPMTFNGGRWRSAAILEIYFEGMKTERFIWSDYINVVKPDHVTKGIQERRNSRVNSYSQHVSLYHMLPLLGVYNEKPEFGYSGEIGPDHWVDMLHYDTCDGKLQSPINIEENLLVPVRFPPLNFFGFENIPDSCVLTNNGHTVLLEFETNEMAVVSGGPLKGKYVFSQLHFHWGENDSLGSEDKINNHSFPMELHMVLYKQDYGSVQSAMRYKDGLAVLAVFYEVSDFENGVYSEIVQHLDGVERPHTHVELLAPLTLESLLPSNKYHYYTYNGSLTTPPCSEVVTWLDFKEPIFLSHSQVAAFRHLRSSEGFITHNNRPVQPLDGRTVYYNVGERPFVIRSSSGANGDNGPISLQSPSFRLLKAIISSVLQISLVLNLLY